MAERYEVLVKVVSQKGTCFHEHKVGDQWVISGKTPGGMCVGAFHVLYPDFHTLMSGGSIPWSTDPDASLVVCPDPKNPVVFELRRLRK